MQWEYMVREFRVQDCTNVSLLEEFLNETGRDGWELVNVAPMPADPFAHLVYLKRGRLGSGVPGRLPRSNSEYTHYTHY